jgi:hypothetical protein
MNLLQDFELAYWEVVLNYRLDFVSELHYVEVQHILLVIAKTKNSQSTVL